MTARRCVGEIVTSVRPSDSVPGRKSPPRSGRRDGLEAPELLARGPPLQPDKIPAAIGQTSHDLLSSRNARRDELVKPSYCLNAGFINRKRSAAWARHPGRTALFFFQHTPATAISIVLTPCHSIEMKCVFTSGYDRCRKYPPKSACDMPSVMQKPRTRYRQGAGQGIHFSPFCSAHRRHWAVFNLISEDIRLVALDLYTKQNMGVAPQNFSMDNGDGAWKAAL